MDTFRHHLVRADLASAKRLIEAEKPLPTRLWKAHVGGVAHIPTWVQVVTADDVVTGIGVETLPGGLRIPRYSSVGKIADRADVWHRAMGLDTMLRLIGWMADEAERGIAWNYAYGEYGVGIDYPRLPTAPQIARKMLDAVSRTPATTIG